MTAATVGDLFARDRRTDRPALEDATGRTYDAHWLCTSAWKAGNFLRHSGVREGVSVGVVGSGPMALLSFFGTTLLEGTTRFDPPTNLVDEGTSESSAAGDAYRVVVAPTPRVGDYRLPTGGQRIGYGESPDEPAVHHLDTGLWSENPSFPPIDTDPETPVLTDGDRTVTHGELLECGRDVIATNDIETGDRVVVRAPLSDPRAVAAGVIAPLLADGVCVLSSGHAESNASEGSTDAALEDRGAYAVTMSDRESTPEPRRIDLERVSI
ncbi:hypothetical protein HALLA_14645 [Halostagnicola larsenii XH-48]|uniref:Acetyl-CoA synthetase n=1 Tax=Halostagnicola larsenii XH-48 TaxID=797299 RepID=W0JMB0_9EURY|nr:hypothetical protein [Halostagnicola larsenii]AHF99840.1 hypothetical protein HALLA_14645 [Halostagnicola larsenii XH-48]